MGGGRPRLLALATVCIALAATGMGPYGETSAESQPQSALHPPLADGETVWGDPVITPDGTSVVYIVDHDSEQSLYSVPVTGGTPTLLGTAGFISTVIVTADSTKAVFVGTTNSPGKTEVSVAELDGSNTFRANAPLGADRDVMQGVAVSPDSSKLVYRADQDSNDVFELYLTTIDGGGPGPFTKLNGPLPAGGRVTPNSVRFDPTGEFVVWRAEQNAVDRIELYSYEVATFGPAQPLNLPLVGTRSVTNYQISPDGTRVVYRADQQSAGVYELYSAPTDAAFFPVRVSDALGGDSDVDAFHRITPDSSTVVYTADREVDGIRRVFSTPIDGSAMPTPLSPPPVPGRVVFPSFEISPDGSRVAYRADHAVDNVNDLYTVPTDGSSSATLISPSVTDVYSFVFSPDSSLVMYSARQDDPGVMELYARPADGAGPLQKVNPPLADGRVTSTARLIEAGGTTYALYEAGYDLGSFEGDLYLTSFDKLEVAAQVNDAHVRGGDVDWFALTPTGNRVVFTNGIAAPTPDLSLYSESLSEVISKLPDVDAAAMFRPLPPARLFDTRSNQPAPGPKGYVEADSSIDVQVRGAGGVPDDATAVVMNVTVTETEAPGFVTAYPTGEAVPVASSLNSTAAVQTRPNLVTVPIGAGGKVSLYSLTGAHLLGDVAGYYVDVDMARPDGRVVPLTPTRLFDTRPDQPAPGPKGLVADDTSIDVAVLGVAGVPKGGVSAVIVNVTGTASTAATFVTAWPTGSTMPLASTLNFDGPGETSANLAIIPIGDDGKISLYSLNAIHLLGDVTGYVTSSNAPVDDAGLFVELSPTRLFDTRENQPAPGPKGFLSNGETVSPQIGGVAGIPTSAGAAVLNVTATGAASGFVTAWPNGEPRPLASTLNLAGPNDSRPNAAILPIGDENRISFYVLTGADVLADTTGFYLG